MHWTTYALFMIISVICVASLRFNLRQTVYDGMQQDCLHILSHQMFAFPQWTRYCLSESSSRWINHIDRDQPHLTFDQLAEKNITSQQLYLWSAPMDVAENYQQYLDQLSSTKDDKMTIDDGIFYNCTWPRFGSYCEYSFSHLSTTVSRSSSLSELVREFYARFPYQPTTFTCYEHLKCSRGSSEWCLDWSEVCDGVIDCLNNGVDEEQCWQLEVHECAEDEYQCRDGQCIPRNYAHDATRFVDCLDGSDEYNTNSMPIDFCEYREPTTNCEDRRCDFHRQMFPSVVTSSCHRRRSSMMMRTLFSVSHNGIANHCWNALECMATFAGMDGAQCRTCLLPSLCRQMIQQFCSDEFLFLPIKPVLFGHIYFANTKNYFMDKDFLIRPEWICFENNYCNMNPRDNITLTSLNRTCYKSEQLSFIFEHPTYAFNMPKYLQTIYSSFRPCNSIIQSDSNFCRRFNLFQCKNTSKCISKRRLLDGISDCWNGDDEQLSVVKEFINLDNNSLFFKCSSSDVYISDYLVEDGICDCPNTNHQVCDDGFEYDHYIQTHLSFQTLCDGFTELLPIQIDGHIMTDETHCDHWPCSNIYTRCDGIWNCYDGSDEVDCDYAYPWTCPSDQRACVLPDTAELTCMSVDRMNDGHVDCLGGTDEVRKCRLNDIKAAHDRFYCLSSTNHSCIEIDQLCDGLQQCQNGEDEKFCQKRPFKPPILSICQYSSNIPLNMVEKYFCQQFASGYKKPYAFFSLENISTKMNQTNILPTNEVATLPLLQPRSSNPPSCHRGIPLQLWFQTNSSYHSSNQSTITCLCPSSYYGPFCQYQSQRISLTLGFREPSDSTQNVFAVLIFLIQYHPLTRETLIHSVQQLTYLPMRDCQMKHSLNLLYATRTSNGSLNYSIHIHIYDKITFTHRSTWHFPILFPFLPVYRLSLQLYIPSSKDESVCANIKCGSHGRCIPYSQHQKTVKLNDTWFCQCDRGWSGRLCTQPITSTCSSDSLSLGTLITGRSICLCPLDKIGDRCLIKNNVCEDQRHSNLTCFNNGICIPNEDGSMQKKGKKLAFTCICPHQFTGDRCEIRQTQLIVTFDSSSLTLPEYILLHYIRYQYDLPHEFVTTMKYLTFNQNTMTVYCAQPFHLAFIELHHHQYYLAVMGKTLISSNKTIEKLISTSDRCPHISELFNHTFLNYHPFRRIKYYHFFCQTRSSSSLLSCFHDDSHLCICDLFEGKQRQANCVEFNHQIRVDCFGQNGCENGGRCFQDHALCPQESVCVCPKCFFGRRCQFSMSGHSLSLDGILGYHIHPQVAWKHQPLLVHVSFTFTLFISITAVMNGFCSLITFEKKKVLEMGCGHYLLALSYMTLFTTVFFVLKFTFLITSQMGHLTHRSFLSFQCIIIDYCLRLCLNLSQWLSGCVAFERTITTIQGTSFNKEKSRRSVKYTMVILFLVVSISTIYDPMYRRMIDDRYHDENRTWCIVSYPSWLRTVDAIMTMFHFGVPFLINILSAMIIVWKTSRIRTHMMTNHQFRTILKKRLQEHQHLLISPSLIVILSCPRLVIAIVAGCMQGNRAGWIYLIGYMVSVLPVALTFVFFVVPSTMYKRQFQQSLLSYKRNVRYRLSYLHGYLMRRV